MDKLSRTSKRKLFDLNVKQIKNTFHHNSSEPGSMVTWHTNILFSLCLVTIVASCVLVYTQQIMNVS